MRPTSDRVRETVFNILGSMGGVEDHIVLDLFCGSGAMGIEALSRGAASVTFVDHDSSALDAARANLQAVGLGAAPATFVRAELPGWVCRVRADIALCDPPYSFGDWETLLSSLVVDVAVVESARPVTVPAGWVIMSQRRDGGTLITVLRHSPAPVSSGAAPTTAGAVSPGSASSAGSPTAPVS